MFLSNVPEGHRAFFWKCKSCHVIFFAEKFIMAATKNIIWSVSHSLQGLCNLIPDKFFNPISYPHPSPALPHTPIFFSYTGLCLCVFHKYAKLTVVSGSLLLLRLLASSTYRSSHGKLLAQCLTYGVSKCYCLWYYSLEFPLSLECPIDSVFPL